MLGRTHAIIGALAVSSLTPPFVGHESAVPILFCGVLGALLPDLDSPRSLLSSWKIGRIVPLRPLAYLINKTFGHRGPMHSLLGWTLCSIGFLFLSIHSTSEPFAGLALSLGYLSHLAADACTKTGIPLLYPRRFRYHLLPHPLRFSTGSVAEEALFAVLAVLLLAQLISVLIRP